MSSPFRVASPRRRPRRPRSGVTVLIVLALLAVTLALSYAMMRSQVTHDRLQHNFNRNLDARQAALAGLSAGLRKMNQKDWAGIGVDLTGNLGDEMSYRVSYATGDPALNDSHPDYHLYAYRVTVTSTGTAVDPADSSIQSSHTTRAIVQLVPRRLSDVPDNWESLQNYTVYQWATGWWREVDLELPVRIEGPAYLQNEVELCEDYPGDGDERPFAGTIDEVAIFGKALSDDQIEDLYDGELSLASLVKKPSLKPVCWWRLDESPEADVAVDKLGRQNGAYQGATAGASPAPQWGGSGAAHFDGFNDQIHLGTLDVPGGEITILAWFKADHFDNADARIISKATSTEEDDHYWMLSTTKSVNRYRLRCRLKTDQTGTSTLVANSGNLRAGEWVFAAMVYDGDRIRLYKDGEEVRSQSKSGNIPTNPDVLVAIGNNPPGSPRGLLLHDYQRMRSAGLGDYRPLTGPVYTPVSQTPAEIRSLIEDDCNAEIIDITPTGSAPLLHPGEITSYQIYPGGQVYSVPELAGTLQDVTLGPDPLTNPLGVYKRRDQLRLRDNAKIQGTVITYGLGILADIEIDGEQIQILPADLPPLYGDSATYQLPSAIAGDDIYVFDHASGSLRGLALTWDDFEITRGSQKTAFDVQGRLIVGEFEAHSRHQWDHSSAWWQARAWDYLEQLDEPDAFKYFPHYLQQEEGLDVEPKLTVRPDPAAPRYHWHDWTQPLFLPHPDDDGGLRWDLIDWQDNP